MTSSLSNFPAPPNGKIEIYSTHARTLLAPPLSSIFALALQVAATGRRPNLRREDTDLPLPTLLFTNPVESITLNFDTALTLSLSHLSSLQPPFLPFSFSALPYISSE